MPASEQQTPTINLVQLRINTVVAEEKHLTHAAERLHSACGVGLMLMREEHARHGVEQGLLASSPIAHASSPLHLSHLSSRGDDPLIRAFLEAARDVLPGLAIAEPPA